MSHSIASRRHGEVTAIYLVYNALLLLFSPILGLLLALRLAKGKSREGWSERWGRVKVAPAEGRRRIWFHAASVGEVMAAMPILREYRKMRPDDDIVLSVITPGGHEVGRGMLGKPLSSVFYAPFDAPFAVKRTVQAVRPDVFVNLETELWPNLLYQARKAGARLVLVNGRISDRSFGRYRRLRWLFRWVLGGFDRLLAQTRADADRLAVVGAPPDRVEVFGNAKFDEAAAPLSPEEVEALRADFHLGPAAPVLVIGSTRQADEERILLEEYQVARRLAPDLALIHAPRHVERAREVAEMYRRSGLRPVLRTELEAAQRPVDLVVLDTFGELGKVYALASAVFIGNSMTPPGGGQNLLQALAQGKPVFYGPYMQNFRDIAAMAESAGVAKRVSEKDRGHFAGELGDLLEDARKREELAARAVRLVESNRGAAKRYAEAIAALADGHPYGG